MNTSSPAVDPAKLQEFRGKAVCDMGAGAGARRRICDDAGRREALRGELRDAAVHLGDEQGVEVVDGLFEMRVQAGAARRELNYGNFVRPTLGEVGAG